MAKRKYPTKEECAERGWYNKTELRQRRLKPAPGQFAVDCYWQGQGWVDVYDQAHCVPMRPYRTPTAAQTAALARGRELVGTRACETPGCTNRIYTDCSQTVCDECARAAHAATIGKAVFLDTETTGLDDDAQVVEIAIVDDTGAVLFESLVKPTVPVDPEAAAIHGIGPDRLASAPAWPEIAAQVREVLEGRVVVIFNAAFDTRILAQTAAAHGDRADWVREMDTRCAMYRAADVYGATNRYGTISLINAAARAGIRFQGRAHSAAGDAATTALLWRTMFISGC